MKYNTVDIKSVGDLISKLILHLTDEKLPVWFRGQANTTWKLEPKFMRMTPRPPESHLLNKFKQDASFILNNKPASEFEWLFLMQHYGVSTRLLDWTESPLVSLYFALNDEKEISNDGAIWVLLPTELNHYSRYRPDFEGEIPSFDDLQLESYLPSVIAAENKTSLFPMAAIAPRNSPRMQAQKGVFTISHRDNIYIEEAGDAPFKHIWKYNIPASSKNDMLKELRLLQINKFHLFPELSSLAENL